MHPAVIAVTVLATTSGRSFHIGPWIIVPLLALAAIVGTPLYLRRERRKRRARDRA